MKKTNLITVVCNIEELQGIYLYDVVLPSGYVIDSSGKVSDLLGKPDYDFYQYCQIQIANQRKEDEEDFALSSEVYPLFALACIPQEPVGINRYKYIGGVPVVPFDWRN